MIFHFATISTQSHLYKTFALIDSVLMIEKKVQFHVLIIDCDSFLEIENPNPEHIFFYVSHQIKHEKSTFIFQKYKNQKDKIRWSFKPVFLDFLLQQESIRKVIYVDNDIAFFGEFQFLFQLLEEYDFLLTPHYYSYNPKKNQNWLEANFRVGLFNAGFIGVNQDASTTLNWWVDCCLYRCEKNPMRGLFDDQKYLDLVPIINSKCHIVRHQGCNVADWNADVLKRELLENKVFINRKFPVVFIHFNGTSIQNFLAGNDVLLRPYFDQYVQLLKKQNPYIDLKKEAYSLNFWSKIKLKIWHLLNYRNGTAG